MPLYRAQGLKATAIDTEVLVGNQTINVGTEAIGSLHFVYDDSIDRLFMGDPALSTNGTEPVSVEFCPPAVTSRSRGFRFAPGNVSGLNGAELNSCIFNLSHTVTFDTGGLALQREMYIPGPTYDASGAKTITTAATVYITAPIAGANVTFGTGTDYYTGNFALYSGPAHFANSNAGAVTGPSSAKKPPALISCCTEGLTGISTGYEYRHVSFNTGQTHQWAGAPPATWRGVVLSDAGSTLASDTAGQTIGDACSVYIAGPPVAGTNVTITRPAALRINGHLHIDNAFGIIMNNAGGGVQMRNYSTSGYCEHYYMEGTTLRGAIGFGNASVADATRANRMYIGLFNGADFVITDGASVRFRVNDTGETGFFGGGPASKQTVTGSRGGNAALASLLTALAAYGLITDSSSV